MLSGTVERRLVLIIEQISAKYKIRISDKSAQWLTREVLWMEEVLQTLPTQFVQCTQTIFRERSTGDARTLGQTKTNAGCNRDVLSNECSYDSPEISIMDIACRDSDTFKKTLVHEMAYNYVAKAHHSNIQDDWDNQFWNDNQPKTPSVTDY